MIEKEMLLAIDNIDDEMDDSSFCVLESLVSLYSKEIDFMDFCSNELKNEIFMEGEILDEVKKQGKKDSNKLITFLAFIPRLIIATCKAIGKAFSDSSLGKKIQQTSDAFDKKANAEQKKAKVAEINQKEGKETVYFDEKSGKIKFTKTWHEPVAALFWLAATADMIYNLFTNIKAEFDVTNPSKIRTFIDECDKIIHKQSDASKSEMIDMGIGALGDMIDHVSNSAGLITTVGAAASTLVTKKLEEHKLNDSNPEDHKVLVTIKELSNKMMIINAGVFAATKIIGVGKKMLKYLGIFVERGEAKQALSEAAVERAYNSIPENQRPNVTREPNETDYKYRIRVLQQFFENIARAQAPKGTSDDEIYNAVDNAMDDIIARFKGEINEEALREYRAAVDKYYADKRALHQRPTIFSKGIPSAEDMQNFINSDEVDVI